MQIDIIITFIFSVFFLTITPGPDIAYVFFKSASHGKIEGFKLTFGLTTGLFIHTLLVVFGVSKILNSNEIYFDIIKGCIKEYIVEYKRRYNILCVELVRLIFLFI